VTTTVATQATSATTSSSSSSSRKTLRRLAERRVGQVQDFCRRALLLLLWQAWQMQVTPRGPELTQSAEHVFEVGPEVATTVTLRRLALEFRHRVSAFFLDLVDHAPADEPQRKVHRLAEDLELARRKFGRLLHATFFLYQKLRTLVPSELQGILECQAAPSPHLPFYVMPYKLGAAGLAECGVKIAAPQGGEGAIEESSCVPESFLAWIRSRIAELEEALPLEGGNCTIAELPGFIAELLRVRGEALSQTDIILTRRGQAAAEQGRLSNEEAFLHDRLDVLLADALTMYMSTWRSAPGARPGQRESRTRSRNSSSDSRRHHHRSAVGEPYAAASAGVARPSLLRLGPNRR